MTPANKRAQNRARVLEGKRSYIPVQPEWLDVLPTVQPGPKPGGGRPYTEPAVRMLQRLQNQRAELRESPQDDPLVREEIRMLDAEIKRIQLRA